MCGRQSLITLIWQGSYSWTSFACIVVKMPLTSSVEALRWLFHCSIPAFEIGFAVAPLCQLKKKRTINNYIPFPSVPRQSTPIVTQVTASLYKRNFIELKPRGYFFYNGSNYSGAQLKHSGNFTNFCFNLHCSKVHFVIRINNLLLFIIVFDLQTNIYKRNTSHPQDDLRTITARPIEPTQQNLCKPLTRSAVDVGTLSDIRDGIGSRLSININFSPTKTKMISSFLMKNWCSYHTYPH